MAPKSKNRLVDQPPSASSSNEDEELSEQEQIQQQSDEESEEVVEEDEDEENTPSTPTSNHQGHVLKSQSSPESGGGREESEPESQGTQPSPSASDFTIKPIVPSKPPPSPSPLKAKPSAKRALVVQNDSRKKRSRLGEGDGPAEKKSTGASSGSSRLWSEEDEIAVLKGMIDYKAQKGTDPNADVSAFRDFIKDKLHAEISKIQMYDKIRRFKKKFMTNSAKGDNPSFAKPHDSKSFELSKRIWGNVGKSPNAISNHVELEPNAKIANEKAKKPEEVKKTSESKKRFKASNHMDAPNEEESEKKKRKNSTKDEENEKKKRKKQKTAPGEKDKQIAVAEEKDERKAVEGSDNQIAVEGNDEQIDVGGNDKQIAVEGNDKQTGIEEKDKHTALEEKDTQITFVEVVNGGVETEEVDFKSKYPNLANSFSKKNYPMSSQETLDMLKEKLKLIGNSKAEEIEEKWTKLWEEQAELSGKMADLLAQQIKSVLDAIKR